MSSTHVPPNIVLILADDMGYGDFGAFNGGLSQTPTLDGLMQESICFTQHYSASPICAPARASLLTGRYPHRTGAIETRELRGLCNLALREVTLADLLKQAGYATGLVGKWHNGSIGKRFTPNARGFDEFVGFRSGWQDYFQWVLDRNGTFEKSDGRYLTDVFTDEAAQFVDRHKDGPFFLHLTYNTPHTPLQAPADEIRPFDQTGQFTRAVSTIYAMIHRMDTGIARILQLLRDRGLEDNTLLLFTSDNGPDLRASGIRFSCGFRGAKGNVYEGGIRVPTLLRWPAGLERGAQLDEMTHFCDWLPTLLAAAGVEAPVALDIDGANILPVLQGHAKSVPATRFWQWNRYQPLVISNAAMRDGEWKLVRPVIRETVRTDPADVAADGALRKAPWEPFEPVRDPFPPREAPPPPPPELYNIADDPQEKHDLSQKHPDRTHAMLRELEVWFEQVESDRATIGDIWGDEPTGQRSPQS